MGEKLGGDIYLSGGARGGARKKMYKEKNCSPKKSNIDGSCLDKDLIHQVAKSLNKMKNKNLTHINLNQSAEDIHGDICQNIQKISKCSSEACWITLESLMKELIICS